METDALITKPQPSITQRLLLAVVPVLFIAITYVDPGKWVAAIEGGARFGNDLMLLMFVFSLAAVLCQYLSASIAVVTGRDLAQICSVEYDKTTCIFLGVQAELSMIALDLSMILGTAHGLSLTFGIGQFTAVFLTSLDAFLFPLFSSFLETGKAKFVCVCLATVALLSYLFGVLMSQQDTSLVMGGMLTKFSGESAFALMSLLGASIMPHNFYLHSSMVQQNQGPTQVSKGALCHDHLFAISCIFSAIFLVNYVLMNSAANVFYSTGLDLLTFQDALSLMDQVFRSLMAPFALILVLLLSNHTAALTWKFGGQAILHNFFKIDVPGWCHHSTIRFIAVIPALLCAWHSGAEGTYQLLIFTQIVVALLLPSSVIPLFRVAMSRPVMGVGKISQLVEYLVMVTCIGMLGLAVVFVVEMLFGNSDWASNLKWSMGSGVSIPYMILLMTAFFSISFMLWLVATPLKSAHSNALKWDVPGSLVKERTEDPREKEETTSPSHEKPVEYDSDPSRLSRDFNLPDELMDYDNVSNLTTIEENENTSDLSVPLQPDESATMVGSILKKEDDESVEKTLRIDGNSRIVKDHEHERDPWEPEELRRVVSGTNQSPTSDGPGSFRGLSLRTDDVGSGAGSLSKLAGLGRAARRQLATTLDDFWKLFFDLHGEVTQDAKTGKLDKLLGIDSKVNVKASPATSRMASPSHEFNGYNPSVGVQRGSPSLLSSYQQLLDAYALNPSLSVMDPGEKRYHSLRLPQASGAYNDQPATVHGYQIKSYINQTKQRSSDYSHNQMEPVSPKSLSLVSSNYKAPYSLTKTQQNGLRPAKPPGFPDPVISRNSSMQPEKTYLNLPPTGPVGAMHEKKYYSMPDISGLLPNRDSSSLPERDSAVRYGTLGPSVYSGPFYKSLTPSSYSGFTYSKLSRDAASYQPVSSSGLGSGSDPWSMWSKQPSEQFGLGEKVNPQPSLDTHEAASVVDSEANILKSFRLCVVKLLKLEGSDWLFKQNDGLDEDLVDRVAARERFLYEVESNEMNRVAHGGTKVDEAEFNKYPVNSVPNCGEGCVWRVELIKSFGVWCIHRILELSLMESRPELWGKYTYVLNRLQGIIEPAFSRARTPTNPCFCLQLPDSYQPRSSPPKSNTSLPPPAKQSRGKCTTAASLLDIVKDIEIAISCRKGRTGTAAGDVAFPKGKENLASVLKRYKRRLIAVVPDGNNRGS